MRKGFCYTVYRIVPTEFWILIGVGRDRLSSAPPPSEPDRRISRIRLSSWWLSLRGTDVAAHGLLPGCNSPWSAK